ncbi:MAG: GntR family transcriptional regulator [Oscillospiraceae bacterium]|nr:GntR family transcriptional regulator [Oscillospiraceae bacterium]
MDELNIVRMNSQQLSYRTKMALISIIRENGKDGKPFKLPNEDELATRLGVSRNVLRDALMSLEELGFVTRRRSKGTIASPAVANATCRLDTDPELFRMIQRAGYTPGIKHLFLGVDSNYPPEENGVTLKLVSKKIFYADETPAALCIDRFAEHEPLSEEDLSQKMRDQSHKDTLENIYGTAYAYTMAHIDAVLPDEETAACLGVSTSAPVLLMEDYGYNYDHELIVRSTIYFRPGILDLKFLRKNW